MASFHKGLESRKRARAMKTIDPEISRNADLEEARLLRGISVAQTQATVPLRLAQPVPPFTGFLFGISENVEGLLARPHLEKLSANLIRTAANPRNTKDFHFRPLLAKNRRKITRNREFLSAGGRTVWVQSRIVA